MPVSKQMRFTECYAIMAIALVLWLDHAMQQYRRSEPPAYSEFQALLKEGGIKQAAILGNLTQGEFRVPLEKETLSEADLGWLSGGMVPADGA
jgi:hypothetical protein